MVFLISSNLNFEFINSHNSYCNFQHIVYRIRYVVYALMAHFSIKTMQEK